MSAGATITIDGKTVTSFVVPDDQMGQPSTQCAWLRDRVNDALTAELNKQQSSSPASQENMQSKGSDAEGSGQSDDDAM